MSVWGSPVCLGGGSGGNVVAFIPVTYPSGSTCTCSDGTTTLRAGDTSGAWVFDIPYTGTWTVSCTDGAQSRSYAVQITAKGQSYTVILTYTLLIASSMSAILADAMMEAYSPAAETWGGLTLEGQSGFTVQSDGSVNLYGDNQSAYCDLGAVNTSVTNYMVFKSLTSSGQTRLITNVAADGAGYCPGLYRSGSEIWTTLWGSDMSTNVSAVDAYHCIAIANDCSSAKQTRYFVDGSKVRTLTHTACGRYSQFTATTKVAGSSYRFGGNTNIKYMAVVGGAEADATIIANMQNIMSHYEIGE